MELRGLQQRVRKGQLKAAEQVGAAAARILARNHGSRYFDWEYQSGRFRYFEHPINLKREKAHEGMYLIQTEEENLSPVEAVQVYKDLSDVERSFATLKDIIALRPVWHQTDERVEAHVFVATLALLLHRGIEKKLKAAGCDLSATEALQCLRTVRVVDLDVGQPRRRRTVTRGSDRAAQILTALGIQDTHPPAAPRNAVSSL